MVKANKKLKRGLDFLMMVKTFILKNLCKNNMNLQERKMYFQISLETKKTGIKVEITKITKII